MKILFISRILFFIFLIIFSGCRHTPIHYGNGESVIVIHGFARRARSMRRLADAVHDAGYEVRNVNYVSIRRSLDEIKADVFGKFDRYISNNPSKKIHFVGHSLGGLLIRSYLDQAQIENLGSVILMGTPNKGTSVADRYEGKWYVSWMGALIADLGAGNSGFLETLEEPYYTVGVIAGSKPYKWFTHAALEGMHDGLVTVESAKLSGMTDFVVIDVNHSRMKRDKRVIDQVIYFLKHSRFKK